jgi:hypothetical protein
MRKNIGVALLALSVIFFAADLMGTFKPMFLRMRAHGGTERFIAVILGSLSLKAVILFAGILLAFWPERAEDR